MTTDAQKLDWYRRRVKALEDLLVKYRVGGWPSEKLHAELEQTGQRINSWGVWCYEDAEVQG